MGESLKKMVARVVRPDVCAMSAYHVPNATGMVKLDAMENPYSWPGELTGWPEILAGVEANRYPDPAARELTAAVRQAMAIGEEYAIVLGNGSDELIHLLIQLIAAPGARVIAPEPSFVMYRLLAEANRVEYQGVPLREDFQLDMPRMLAAVAGDAPSVLFLACPNNPTGIRYHEADIRQLVEASRGLVVVDEAYIAFSSADALPLLNDYPNLLVMRTLSKMGLAGLRLGILVGRPEWTQEVDKLRLPYNINVLTQVAAKLALQNYSQMLTQAIDICHLREALFDGLHTIRVQDNAAFTNIWASQANFILLRTQPDQAKPIFESLKQQGVLIKCLDGAHPALADCLRITVGKAEENAILLEALHQACTEID